jgi:hypothetical protein
MIIVMVHRVDTRPRRRTQRERTAESTRRLLDAAIELIAEKGFERTTAMEIGERAGYSRSMVRARYGSKEALLESVLRNDYEPLMLAPEVNGQPPMRCTNFSRPNERRRNCSLQPPLKSGSRNRRCESGASVRRQYACLV